MYREIAEIDAVAFFMLTAFLRMVGLIGLNID